MKNIYLVIIIYLFSIYYIIQLLKIYKLLNYKNIILYILLSLICLEKYLLNYDEIRYLSNLLLVISSALIILVDIKEMIIPSFGIILLIMSRLMNIKYHEIDYSGFIFIAFLIVIILLISLIMKKELMGFGDLKLYLIMSFSMSIIKVNVLLIISALFGLLFTIKNKKIPFGPGIVLSYLILNFMIN